jgi:8-oxo-dGTP pyrophosphatase MutT (NUDIX family)
MTGSSRWLTHGTRRIYASPWVNLDLDDVEVPGGGRFDHHVIRFPRRSVGVVVVRDGRVLLLWRHRFATDRWGWEIPAGWAEVGEDLAEAAAREALEETGYRVAGVVPLTTYTPLSGISSQVYQLFLASEATLVGEPEAAEADRVEWVPVAEVVRLMRDGQISDGPSLMALAFYLATR